MAPPKDREDPQLAGIFNKFAGREVPLTEEKLTIRGKTYTQLRLANDKDPVVREMRDAAQENGLQLRLWWPGAAGTMDFRLNRVNAHIEKSADGKWRVGGHFNRG